MTADPLTPTKPGWKTTEYWLAKITIAVGLLMTSGLLADGSTGARIAGAIMAALASLGYSYSRGLVKAAAALALAFGVLGAGATGCGPSARQLELRATLTGLNAAGDALVRADARHQAELVQAATSAADGLAKLTAYQAARDRVIELFGQAYHAIAVAAVLQPTAAQAAAAAVATAAAMEAWDELRPDLEPAAGGHR